MVMLISTICAPADAPQIFNPLPTPLPLPRLDRLDNEIVEAIRENGIYGAQVWAILNGVADAQNPACRDEARSIRLQLWQRLRRLLSAGLIFRFRRKYVSSVKLPRLTVRRSRRSHAGSTFHRTGDEKIRSVLKSPNFNLSGFRSVPNSNPRLDAKTEIATLAEQASEAGRSLARLR
jgi:hypothetical protein